ncbi:arginine--tRNA ligase [Borrelia hermsii]|uniref:Arginine--tRNA ligase n=3 Tax=Borrelia hermsii TaxID=140 RepID=SYR_BORHD|nr:arginine--tRNA ligase [Borrelia hermsii]B2S0U2.1 RecName: Full=Arginine--tRNA ligase; AltName: Full=Arginyl-tRNA synthetase; Short=ArgRS [Borrelia hermsii DAH]AAX17098.1 arginyl-tRNA synthetase [Borrelia hermsii DAH]AJW73387.1 arginyl-tRNA synthetase [Borrelia hermsii CC1]AMR75258.1 Arginyl-tRNA synthetase [Borrelia hermsii]ANA43397.1 arginine--tRNA ligase [Borrelia hermsii HS1]UCP01601.1 arginine--tRNA ligase [Borrelia hermsii]
MNSKIKKDLKDIISKTIKELALRESIKLEEINIIMQKPPKSELGDLSILIFEFSKILKLNTSIITEEIIKQIGDKYATKAMGPYLNIKFNRKEYIKDTIKKVNEQKEKYGINNVLKNKRIIIEFSSPNTNKPLHIGHLRNDIIGESLSRILKASGAQVTKINLINDRGTHICKSMLAYKKFGNNTTPELSLKKGDHLIGDFYVKYNEYAKNNEMAEDEIQQLLCKWEEGDEKTVQLWKKLNQWAIEGIKATYKLTNITFDKIYLESEIFKIGREIILKGLEEGLCYKREDGAICIDIPTEKNEISEQQFKQKVLLRANGTSIYLTQDLGNIVTRKNEFDFDEMIYVVGSEQIHHFKTLFYVANKLGITKENNLVHLSYGMVNLPEGKMKSREGNVIDADNLIHDLSESIILEIKKRNSDKKDYQEIALNISLGAIHYYLLKTAIHKDILFNKEESLSFTGNSGPYIQYVGARINSILEKYDELNLSNETINFDLLVNENEWEIIKIISEFEEHIIKASKDRNPSVIANYSYLLAKSFSTYYQDTKIIDKNKPELTHARIDLSKAVLQTIKNCMHLLNIPYMKKM